MVMPRSRSRSMSSRSWARNSRWVIVPVCNRNWSARVDFPWSMWAMIEKLRIRLGAGIGSRVGKAKPTAVRPWAFGLAYHTCAHPFAETPTMRLAFFSALLLAAPAAADDVKLEPTTLDGLLKAVAAHKGRVVVVDVWGTF